MKKINSLFTLLTLLLCFPMMASAQTWAFNERDPFLNDADEAAIQADAANWYNDATKTRYSHFTALTNAALTANGVELNITKGLLFTFGAGSANDGGKIRLNYGKEYVEFNATGLKCVIPNVQKGWKVTVVCQSANNMTKRALYADNLSETTGFGTQSTSQQTCTGVVTETGDVTLTTTDGGLLVYSISAVDPNNVTPEPVNPDDNNKVNNAVQRNTNKNQMFVTTNSNSIKYYNTEDVKNVAFVGDNTIITPANGSANDEYAATVKEISFAKAAERGESGEVTENGIKITESKGWQESLYAKWTLVSDAKSYNVYVKGGQYADYTKIDQQLVRNYGTYGRADVVGLKAGNYSLKVVAVDANGNEMAATGEAANLNVKNYDRQGFAHKGVSDGVGAYMNDGTLKAGAKVLYVTKNTFNTVKCTLAKDNKGGVQEYVGIGSIFAAKQKGYDNTPLAVRFIGEIKAADASTSQRLSDQKGLLLKGNNEETVMNVTVEGIGDDACFNGFGFGIINGTNVEVRNMAFFFQGSSDDNMEIKGTQHIWVHNCDYFYGEQGGGDHGKGDGSLDSKDCASFCTFAYNHYHDTGKSNLCGMKSESESNLICYHHNWFDHSDSRHPRVRTSTVHVWNNYYDGVSKYGVGVTCGASVFVESNYFRNTNKPMLISLQGTDAKGEGTFSSEKGGVLKAFGNVFAEKSKNFSYITWAQNNTSFDAYEVADRNETVPSSVVAKVGGTSYNNFDTDASKMYEYTPNAAADIPAIVTGFYGAGRLNQGDIQYTFDNAKDDADYGRCAGLDAILSNYKTSLVGIFGDESAAVDPTPTPDPVDPTPTPDPVDPTPTPDTPSVEGTVVCSFVRGENNVASASNSAFTVTGNCYAKSDRETITVDGTAYADCLKMESATSITFTTTQEMNMTLYFGAPGATKCTAKIDGQKAMDAGATIDLNAKTLTVKLAAGSHSIAKQDAGNLYLIKLVPTSK